jgi:signal transduction histidine kinase/streptogramin lyase
MRIDFVFDAVPLPDHSVWAVSLDGVSRLLASVPRFKKHLEPITASMGLADFPLEAIALDHADNVWVGSDGGGASRVARNGFVSFNETDGLGSHDIISVFENPGGRLCVVSRSRDALFVNTLFGKGFQATRVNLPSDLVSMRWHGHYQVTASAAQDWWVATRRGLAQFTGINDPAKLARTRPRYCGRDENIFRLFQDRRGDLWISDQHYPENVLTILNHRTGAFDRLPTSKGGPDLVNDRIQAYSEDPAGDVWMGLEHGGLWRWSTMGFHHFSFTERLLGSAVNWLFTDRVGRLWVGSSTSGLGRLDKPDSPHPSFASYDTRQGLSSNEILCITEDLAGRIYICTARGVDRLEPSTGRVKHYTTADGLPGGELQTAFRDHSGALWFGTQQGLSRFVPTDTHFQSDVPVVLSSIRVEGDALAIRPAGETKVILPNLSSGRDRVQFDFTALSFEAGDVLRYQFMLKGAEDAWTTPTRQRSVIYAGLRPGRYRFLVRAINSDGIVSSQPASVAFTILPPFWLRWWFVTVVFGTIGFTSGLIRRYRARQLAAVQRVRMRIASDLHDDIGSGLSQIAILSEVVKRQVTQGAADVLDQIAGVSRELVDSMSDIVWATDPNRDQVGDLTQRMLEFAGEVLGGSEIKFRLLIDGIEEKRKLTVNVRRQVYLVYKECINNVVHHSGSTEATVRLNGGHAFLALEVADNGKGFDQMRNYHGYGLASLRDRAAKLGGSIEWTSGATGTTVIMRVPYTYTLEN